MSLLVSPPNWVSNLSENFENYCESVALFESIVFFARETESLRTNHVLSGFLCGFANVKFAAVSRTDIERKISCRVTLGDHAIETQQPLGIKKIKKICLKNEHERHYTRTTITFESAFAAGGVVRTYILLRRVSGFRRSRRCHFFFFFMFRLDWHPVGSSSRDVKEWVDVYLRYVWRSLVLKMCMKNRGEKIAPPLATTAVTDRFSSPRAYPRHCRRAVVTVVRPRFRFVRIEDRRRPSYRRDLLEGGGVGLGPNRRPRPLYTITII